MKNNLYFFRYIWIKRIFPLVISDYSIFNYFYFLWLYASIPLHFGGKCCTFAGLNLFENLKEDHFLIYFMFFLLIKKINTYINRRVISWSSVAYIFFYSSGNILMTSTQYSLILHNISLYLFWYQRLKCAQAFHMYTTNIPVPLKPIQASANQTWIKQMSSGI